VPLQGRGYAENGAKSRPKDIETRRAVGNNLLFIARGQADNGDYKAALENCRAARKTAEALNAQDPSNVFTTGFVGKRFARSEFVAERGQSGRRARQYRSAYAYIDKLSGADPGDKGHRRGLAVTYLAMGDALQELKRNGQALEYYSKAIASAKPVSRRSKQRRNSRRFGEHEYPHGHVVSQLRRRRQGRPNSWRKAGSFFEETAQRDRNDAGMERDQAELYARLGDLNLKLKRWQAARDSYQDSLNIWLALHRRNLLRRSDWAKPEEMARAVTQSAAHAN